jgi:hypothetical protein
LKGRASQTAAMSEVGCDPAVTRSYGVSALRGRRCLFGRLLGNRLSVEGHQLVDQRLRAHDAFQRRDGDVGPAPGPLGVAAQHLQPSKGGQRGVEVLARSQL